MGWGSCLTPEQRVAVLEEVAKLPVKLRTVTIYYFYGDMTQEQIAAELQIVQSTVNDRLQRGLAELFWRLKKREEFRDLL